VKRLKFDEHREKGVKHFLSILWKDNRGQFEILLFALPLVLCCWLQSRDKRKALAVPTEIDAWFTQKNIEEVFKDIKKEADSWRKKAEMEQVAAPKYFFLGAAKGEEIRFEIVQSIKPRLCRIIDGKEGSVLFELTEVKEGGTSIRVTCTPQIKFRVQTFRARFPAQVPLERKQCSSCGRLVLHDYVSCPYCGQEQAITEKKPRRRKKTA